MADEQCCIPQTTSQLLQKEMMSHLEGDDQEIQAVEAHLDALKQSLELEEDDEVKQETEQEIREYEEKLQGLQQQKSEGSQLRRSERERQLTYKAQQLLDEEKEKREKTFNAHYENWAKETRDSRRELKRFCEADRLLAIKTQIQERREKVIKAYDSLREKVTVDVNVRRKVDTVIALTDSVIQIADFKNPKQETYSYDKEIGHVRSVLNKADHLSIYGSSESATTALDNLSINRANAAADLAASTAEVEAARKTEEKKARLARMESAIKIDNERRALEIEQERGELNILEAQAKEKVARARLRALDEMSQGGSDASDTGVKPLRDRNVLTTHNLNPNACSFVPDYKNSDKLLHSVSRVDNPKPYTSPESEKENLAQTLAETIALSRLPVPEPAVFMGDPLHYTDWKASFMTLIEGRNVTSRDKLYYLRRYVGGPVKSALESYFMASSEQAYTLAWESLEDRYGNNHTVAAAFLYKLEMWPKVNVNNPTALRDFSDFLRSCESAMQTMPDLQVLNNSIENKKMLNKLPDYLVHRWKRTVTERLSQTGVFPNFAEFVNFLQWESKVLCNPIFGSHFRGTPEASHKKDDYKKGRSLATSLTAEAKAHKEIATVALSHTPEIAASEQRNDTSCQGSSDTKTSARCCSFCGNSNHHVATCKEFLLRKLEERKAFIKDNRLCFACLRKGHYTKECQRRHVCGKCKKRHPTCLHDDSFVKDASPSEQTPLKGSEETQKVVTHSLRQNAHARVSSMIIPVWIASADKPNREILTYAMLDTQSDSTFILSDLATELNAKSQSVKLKLSTMTSPDTTIESERVEPLQIRGFNLKQQIPLPPAYTRTFIPVDRSCIPTDETAKDWPHLHSLMEEIPPLQSCDVGLLIGFNCPSALAPLQSIIGQEGEPYAQRTELGWSIVGCISTRYDDNPSSICHRVCTKELPPVTPKDLLSVLEKDFSESSTGVSGDKTCKMSQEDIRFINLMEESIEQSEDGHYVMPLPFKSRPHLPNNRILAVARLDHLKRKFLRDENYRIEYAKFLEDMISNGVAERVCDTGAATSEWYIPHHGVYHPQKGKLRVVFDCSAKFKGTSLNNHLMIGPDLTNSLLGVLWRFRKNSYAIICDIQKMFHQFKVKEEDRTYLRFLWWKNGDIHSEPSDYRMNVHLFGAASSPACANYGLKTIANQMADENQQKAAEFIKRDFYVDDGLTSIQSIDDGVKLIKDAQEICGKGGLRLHKFLSNSRQLMETVKP